MRLVATRRLTPGVCLARDVWRGVPGQVALLTAGTLVTPEYQHALLRGGINAVYVDDQLGAGISVPEALSETTRRAATTVLSDALTMSRSAVDGRSALSTAALAEMGRAVTLIVDDVLDAPDDTLLVLSDLGSADAYTLQHSIDVAALGVVLGERVFRQRGCLDYRGRPILGRDRLRARLGRLGLGLLLHDVGKLAIPSEILNKPEQLTDEETALVRGHPLVGLEMLPVARVSPLARTVVRSHHERWDGSGYPDGKAAEDIHEFARIASVADVYDAVTSERPYHPAAPPAAGVRAIVGGAGTAFDPEVVSVFRRTVAPLPPGTEVELRDGRRGIVTEVTPERPGHPLVRLAFDRDGDAIEQLVIGPVDPIDLVPEAAARAA
jgi:HD-GYP domain-containing protein (c-di-GMP phosphodiesterase class II)